MAGSYSLTLNRQTTANVVEGRTQGYRVLLTIASVVGFADTALFVFQLVGTVTSFSNVASPADLVDLGIGPSHADPDGYYRSNVFDVIFPSQTTAEEVMGEVEAELKVLTDEMANINDLIPPPGDVITIQSDT